MKSLKDRVESAYKKPYGFRYMHRNWDKNLWNKSTQDIKEYLLHRFNTTLDEVEYYSVMVLLYKTIPNKDLLIEFKDSPQYFEMYNHKSDEKTITKSEGYSRIVPDCSKTIKIIGD